MFSNHEIEKLLKKDNEAAMREAARIAEEMRRREREESLCEATGMTPEDAILLLTFAKAAGNLYGIIPLEDFYRIVRELAPELKVERDSMFFYAGA